MPVAKGPAPTLMDLLGEAGSGVCLVAPDGTVVGANAAWLRSAHLTEEQVVGKSVRELFPAAGAPPERGTLAGADPGEPASLRESEAWFRLLSEAMPQIVCVVAPDGEIQYVNAAWIAFSGKGLDETARAGWKGIVHPDDFAAARDCLRRTLSRSVPQEVELRYRTADGSYRWFLSRLAPVVEGGRVIRLVGAGMDIEDRKRAEEGLRHAAEMLDLGDAMCELDADFRVVRVNAQQERLTGLPRSRTLGRTHWELWPETADPFSPWWREYHRCMEERVPVEFENYYAPLELWSSVTAYPTSRGGIAIFFRDATKRKRVEADLREARDRYGLLFKNMLDGFAYCRILYGAGGEAEDFVYVDVNDAFERLTGLHDVIGRRVTELIPGIREAHPELLETYARVVRTGRPERFELEFKPLGIWLAISVYRPRADHFVAAFDNVTDRKQAELALRAADRRKDEFLGMLSHELRNPLAPIRNSIHVLRHAAPGSEQTARAQAVVERQTEHLTRLVDDLLDVTRIARGRIELRRARVDLREVVLRAADDFRVAMDDRGVAFHLEVPASPMWADADATRVTQIVGNLLHNAAKFTRAGDEVRLSLRALDGRAEISVSDTGAGIDAALLPSVFEPFVQGARTLARTEGGLGLGLALVKGIAELHGGTVEARSAGVGKGSQFLVRLPLLPAVAPSAGPAPRPERHGAGRRVLVVDDNQDAAESLADAVRMFGHAVEVAYDGPSAIEAARARPPHVVLCDIGLPGMTGYDVARALRAACDPAMQLLAVSGYAQPEDVERALEAGFDGHVAKPADIAEIERLLLG